VATGNIDGLIPRGGAADGALSLPGESCSASLTCRLPSRQTATPAPLATAAEPGSTVSSKSVQPSQLPHTGAPIDRLLALGVLLVVAGGALSIRPRRGRRTRTG